MAEAPQVASTLSLNKKGSDIVIGSVVWSLTSEISLDAIDSNRFKLIQIDLSRAQVSRTRLQESEANAAC